MPRPFLRSALLSAPLSVLAAAALVAPLAAPSLAQERAVFADELPGYYDFYKRSGEYRRLPEEVDRDASLTEDGEFSAVEVDIEAPAYRLPGIDGELVDLRIGGEGRNTVVTTFQAWW
jgi:hypothetical protein